jgi:hypothetical protein
LTREIEPRRKKNAQPGHGKHQKPSDLVLAFLDKKVETDPSPTDALLYGANESSLPIGRYPEGESMQGEKTALWTWPGLAQFSSFLAGC